MRPALVLIALAFGLSGCSRGPRSAAYFQAHRDEARAVLAACKAGSTRGPECVNALAGPDADARDARVAAFGKVAR